MSSQARESRNAQAWAGARDAARAASKHLPVLVALVAICAIGWQGSGVFFSGANLTNLFQRMAAINVIGVGTAVLMIAGDIDLSIGAAVSLVSIFVAKAVNAGDGTALILAEAVGLGVAIGLVIGAFVTFTRTPAFIVTLGALSVFTGISFVLSSGQPIVISGFEAIGSETVYGIPISCLILIGVDVCVYGFLHRTQLGRNLFAVGGNAEAARLAGINVTLMRVLGFALNGALVGLGASMLTSTVGSGGPTLGADLELQVIAAVVVGGGVLAGGYGSLVGTFLGVLLLETITNVLNLIGAQSYVGSIVFGGFIVLAVGLRGERARGLAVEISRRLRLRGSTEAAPRGVAIEGPGSGQEVA